MMCAIRRNRMTGLACVLDAKQLEPHWHAPWHQAWLTWYDRVGPKVAAWLSDKPRIKSIIRSIAKITGRIFSDKPTVR